MRELKFRVWDEALKEFFFDGFHINSKGTLVNCPWIERTQKERDRLIKENMSVDGKYHQDKMPRMGYIVQQYTGLKDKNGVEIYEGDVFMVKSLVEAEDGEPTAMFSTSNSSGKDRTKRLTKIRQAHIVEWNSTNGGYKLTANRGSGEVFWCSHVNIKTEYEVVGNIHENPEFLGESK